MPLLDGTTSRRRTSRLGLLALVLSGCGPGRPPTLPLGDGAGRGLPEALADRLARDVLVCLDEDGHGGDYRLWILHRPGGTWLGDPTPPPAGFEGRDMPATALETVLRSKLPSLGYGRPLGRKCRYTHWHEADGADVHMREFVTDQGWFSSVERARP